MPTIKIDVPGLGERSVPAGTEAASLLAELGKPAVAAKLDGRVVDVYHPLERDAKLEPILPGSPEALEVLRHSSAHLMAQAVARLFPGTEFAIGPVIEDGFYYDFDTKHKFTPEDLERIEAEMARIVSEDLPIRRIEMSKEDALRKLQAERARFKTELLQELKEPTVSFYTQGEFTDWCRGPHLPSTGRVGAFKLLSIAGAYWRGDERREMLQRIYATSFWTREELELHLHRLEEARKRDHRRLGKELGLFGFHPEAPGSPVYYPKGYVLYDALEGYMKERLREGGYSVVKTPHVLNESLWRQSGHWDHYRENMYFTEIEGVGYAIKPMNCPGSTLVYRSEMRSYRDLPLRLAEFGLCHRYEKSGVLTGMLRVRSFTQDDAHIFCTPEQIESEVRGMLKLAFRTYGDLGFSDLRMELSTRPESSAGTPGMWERAEAALAGALAAENLDYKVNPGDGAFYGPKIDFHLRDSIGRSWQTATIQLDFSMPERFDLSYVASDGSKQRPVMIHRAILGAFERMLGILVEHYAGAFPAWLAPVQAVVLPVSSAKFADYACEVRDALRSRGLRADADLRDEALGYRIREQQGQKVPYMLVVGKREMEARSVSVRRRDGDAGSLSLDAFGEALAAEVERRELTLTIGELATSAEKKS